MFVGTWHLRKRGAELARIFASEVRPQVPGSRLRMVTQDAPSEVPDGVEVLGRLVQTVFFPELWDVRNELTARSKAEA